MTTTTVNRIRSGYTFDPECPQTTYRLRATWAALNTFGVTLEMVHDHSRDHHNRNGKHECFYLCKPAPLPEWVTDEVIQAAADFADLAQTTRGNFNRAQASASRSR